MIQITHQEKKKTVLIFMSILNLFFFKNIVIDIITMKCGPVLHDTWKTSI